MATYTLLACTDLCNFILDLRAFLLLNANVVKALDAGFAVITTALLYLYQHLLQLL